MVVIGFRNSIVVSKNLVKRAWSDVLTYERKKLKLIPELERQLAGYVSYEKTLLTSLTALRAQAASLQDNVLDTAELQAIQQIPGQWVNGWLNKESPVAESTDSAASTGFEYKANI